MCFPIQIFSSRSPDALEFESNSNFQLMFPGVLLNLNSRFIPLRHPWIGIRIPNQFHKKQLEIKFPEHFPQASSNWNSQEHIEFWFPAHFPQVSSNCFFKSNSNSELVFPRRPRFNSDLISPRCSRFRVQIPGSFPPVTLKFKFKFPVHFPGRPQIGI